MHNAQKSDNAQVACEQPVSLTTGHVVADSCSGLSPDTHCACTEVRVAPLKDENREVATVHVVWCGLTNMYVHPDHIKGLRLTLGLYK